MAGRRHETPLPRTNPSGRKVWVARWTDRYGKRQSAGTFRLEREAQEAMDAAYDAHYNSDGRAPRQVGTVDAYVPHWQRHHPRAPRTAVVYGNDLKASLDVKVGGRPLRQWRLDEVERAEVNELVDFLFRAGRAAEGIRGVLRTLSAMWEDAIGDGWTRHNPVRGVRVRSNDPRCTKPERIPNVFSWEQMHAFAARGDQQFEAMARVLSDCGLRLGEMLALERAHIEGDWLYVCQTAHHGSVEAGTKTTRDAREKGRRAPLPPGLLGLLRALPPRLDTRLLFPTENGRVWQERAFYKAWGRVRDAAKMPEASPHDFRHSYVSLMRAAGVDPADLAKWTGHTVLTATTTYTHALEHDAEKARRAVG